MIDLNLYRRKKELEEVLEDLGFSLIECTDPLLRQGIQDNINDVEAELNEIDLEEGNG